MKKIANKNCFWKIKQNTEEIQLLRLCFFLFWFGFWFVVVVVVFETGYSPGYPGTHFLDHVGLELRNPPASASQVLRLKAYAATAQLSFLVLKIKNNKNLKSRSGIRSQLLHKGELEMQRLGKVEDFAEGTNRARSLCVPWQRCFLWCFLTTQLLHHSFYLSSPTQLV